MIEVADRTTASPDEPMDPLPLVAAELQWGWKRTYEALLSGKLAGVRRGARWFVYRRSVDAAKVAQQEVQVA
jgi:hypothetical protein